MKIKIAKIVYVVASFAAAIRAPALERGAKGLPLECPIDATIQIPVSLDGVVINFPSSPERVVLGRKSAFSVETIGSDLAISPLSPASKSSLFVYILGRRFSFRLRAAQLPSSVFIVQDVAKKTEVPKARKK